MSYLCLLIVVIDGPMLQHPFFAILVNGVLFICRYCTDAVRVGVIAYRRSHSAVRVESIQPRTTHCRLNMVRMARFGTDSAVRTQLILPSPLPCRWVVLPSRRMAVTSLSERAVPHSNAVPSSCGMHIRPNTHTCLAIHAIPTRLWRRRAPFALHSCR